MTACFGPAATGSIPSLAKFGGDDAAIFAGLPQQFGFVVSDLADALRFHHEVLGMAPWLLYDYDQQTLPVRTFRGAPGDFVTRSAVLRDAGFSLVQPVSGDSTYSEMLAVRGPGLHHVAYRVASMAQWRPRLIERGFTEVMTGSGHGLDGDGEFAIFDSGGRMGCFVELIEPPKRRRPPFRIIE